MKDQDKTKEQLISELENLRQIAEWGASQRSVGNGDGRMGPDNSQWHSLVANTPVFILILDQVGCIRFANHTDSGAPPDQIVGKNLCDFCTPENRADIRECLQRVFQTGESGLREGPGLRLDHEEHWYASYYGPMFQDGKVIAASLISFKITEQKRAEAGLRESEERFRSSIRRLCGWHGSRYAGWHFRPSQSSLPRVPWILGTGTARKDHPTRYASGGLGGYVGCDPSGIDIRASHSAVREALSAQRWSSPLGRSKLHPDLRYRRQSQLLHHSGIGRHETQAGRDEKLAKSKAMLHAAINCLPFNFFAIGLDGRYMLQNAMSKAHQGGDAIGKLPEEVCQNKHDLAIYVDNNRRAFSGEKVEGEVTLSLGGEEDSTTTSLLRFETNRSCTEFSG